MGSRLAARWRGSSRRTGPTPTAMATPSTTQNGDTVAGMPASARTANEMAAPVRMPTTPPMPESVMASSRNCARMSALPRADGFANADFSRALGNRNQHDVHDSDAAYQQADGADDASEQHHGAGELVPQNC